MNNSMYLFCFIFTFTLFLGCQKDHQNLDKKKNQTLESSSSPEDFQEEIMTDQGFYQSSLKSFDPSRRINGIFSAYILNDDFVVELKMRNLQPGKKYLQFILNQKKCLTLISNSQEIFETPFNAVMKKMGKILLPLDHDLSEQFKGFRYGPISNPQGFYRYKRSSSYVEMMDDLYDIDPDVQDFIIKISTNALLDLSERIVVIFEHDDYDNLGRPLPLDKARPIACGEISRVEEEF